MDATENRLLAAYRRNPVAVTGFCVLAILAVQAFFLKVMGQTTICDCGTVKLWYSDPSGPETSQHIGDWYTYSHVLHGLIFYALLWLVARRLPIGFRLALAVGLEAAWEMAENTPMVIDRYRQSALAEGYFGDSILNSLSDTLAMIAGFVLARVSPLWLSILLVVATEVFMAYMIRDNLTLNILQLVHPSEAVSRWQVGG
ncbi:DUF2585 family protein [Nitratireductor pacificus]|uniref:Uncharacterized protein n=1 Tax=Nitratireductor pacificus pht-3B TaxID=391937 RepID=K2N6H6_9HYPH|nr:DUF2585 family protein [Nitratireductor pacificus]EKF19753.1 hypothetical protein NA2_05413 [Nitratireductor pacificus pht-3B]